MSDIILHLPKEWTTEPVSKIGEVESKYRNINIYVDCFITQPVPDDEFRIIIILEPFEHLKRSMINYFNDYPECYSYIFTYHQDIIDSFKNSMVSVFPNTWVSDYVNTGKEFSVSTVVGNKHLSKYLIGLEGYSVRWDLFNKKDQILMPTKFYLSSNSPIKGLDYSTNLVLKESKSPMFNSQFHIAIENTNKIDNAFSEKIIDCFQSKTVPIYYGPKNIGDFFNTDGIFMCNTVNEIIEVCNNLDNNTYEKLTAAIEDNYNISMKYKSMPETIVNNVKKIFSNNH